MLDARLRWFDMYVCVCVCVCEHKYNRVVCRQVQLGLQMTRVAQPIATQANWDYVGDRVMGGSLVAMK